MFGFAPRRAALVLIGSVASGGAVLATAAPAQAAPAQAASVRVTHAVPAAATAAAFAVGPIFTDPHTAVFVTQLGLTDGRGRITLQAHIGTDLMVGFEARVPAGAGSWVTARDVNVPELGVHCRGGPGPDLHYLCGVTGAGGTSVLPTGNYQVTLPVMRVGAYSDLSGTDTIFRLDSYGEGYATASDTFPVIDARTNPRSSAEATYLTTSGAGGYGVMSETVTVVPAESVWTVRTVLPAGLGVHWRLHQAVTPDGIECRSDAATIRCEGAGTVPNAIRPGRFQLVFKLTSVGEAATSDPGLIALRVNGNSAENQDTFQWRSNLNVF